MADQLLSIQDSNLQMVARAIQNKAQNSSNLLFPDGFVDALNGLDTYANADDLVPPQTVTLTPDKTSHNIAAGTHTGSDVIKIVVQDKTVTPSTSEIIVKPDVGKFLRVVNVNGVSASNRYQIKTGTVTVDNVGMFRISGIGFTPVHCILFLQSYHATSSLWKVASAHSFTTRIIGRCGNRNGYGIVKKTSSSPSMFQFDNGSVLVSNANITCLTKSKPVPVFAGTYYYVVWG